ncbi:MAG: UDP-N-acetylmuramoyl-L-alanyl-D-glutamate--2,6-diaminopimelate ligase [Bacillota bacterium]|nr:UDP-N-acetylmuramoyl-L-alanyl-D-glutamate--2,6-diaminopimelate ligase [Bacillota bacterium]
MKLKDLLKDVDYRLHSGTDEIEIGAIKTDSRLVKKGDIFFALTGLGSDGHNYIKKAEENGAAAIVAEHPVECGVTLAVTENSRIAIAKASAKYYSHPSKEMKFIGVTGTNGKTTVTHIIKQILDLKGIKTGLIGTNHYLIGDEELDSSGTTPEAPELHELFRKMADAGCKYVVMENSSHALDLNRCLGIEFEVGVFTNLTEDHLNYHKDMDDYARAKSILFSMSKVSVINGDDSYAKVMKKSAGKCFTYGIDSKADMKAENINYSERGVIFDWTFGGSNVKMRLSIPGQFSVYNALAGIGACACLGLSDEEIAKGLLIVRGVKGRAEVVNTNTPYTVMIDYAHTPDGIENILGAVRGFAKKKIIIVFGCGGDRETAKRPKMGGIAARLADYCVVTSDNPRTENPESIVKQILTGMVGYEYKYRAIVDRTEAIRFALSIAGEGDIVLLAGKGHETYQDVAGRKIDYDEREIIKQILA